MSFILLNCRTQVWTTDLDRNLTWFIDILPSVPILICLFVGICVQWNCDRAPWVRRSIAATGRSKRKHLSVADQIWVGQARPIESTRLLNGQTLFNSCLKCVQPQFRTHIFSNNTNIECSAYLLVSVYKYSLISLRCVCV